MRKIIDSIIKSLGDFFKNLSRRDRVRLVVLAIVIIVLSIVVTSVLGRTTYATLYTGLDAAKSGEIIAELDGLGVPYKIEGTSTILVDEKQVAQVRMQLATMGYGVSNGFTYDTYSSVADGFGKTDLEKQAGLVWQTQDDVRRQLLTMDKVRDCLVKIYIPDKSAFVLTKNDEVASASVTLDLKPGTTLSDSEVMAIASTVSAGTSVPIESISIVDTTMKPYTIGMSNESNSATDLSNQLDLEARVRSDLETQVIALLSPVFGADKVRVSVGVRLNFDDESVHSVEFAPPVEDQLEGLVISMSELYEYSTDSTTGGVVGTDENGLGVPEYPYGTDDGYDYRHIARDINYEINETITEITKAKATIDDLSIAVLLDSTAIDADYTENVHNLVVNAIGVGSNYISVERLPFQTSGNFDAEIELQEAALKRMQLMEIVKLALKALVILIIVIAAISFLRTLLRGILKRDEPALIAAGVPVGSIGEGGYDYMADDDLSPDMFDEFDVDDEGRPIRSKRVIPEIDIDLSGKSDAILQLEKFIDKDSKAIAQLLRNWLIEDE